MNPDGSQLLDGMLGGFGFYFAGSRNIGHQRQVHKQRLVMPKFDTELTNRLQKWQGFDITHGTTDLNQNDIRIVGAAHHGFLDLVRDMRNNLHGSPEVIATALLGDNFFVDTTSRVVTRATALNRGKTLIMTEVKIGFSTIIGDIHFAMLERAHGSWIYIDVGVQFDHIDT